MSNIFISHRFTGEDLADLQMVLNSIGDSLKEAGHLITCSIHYQNFFREQGFTLDQIYAYMLEQQEKCDVFMPIVKTLDKSKGMLLESKKAKELKQRYVLIIKEGLYLPEFNESAQEIITYQNLPDLFETLKSFR